MRKCKYVILYFPQLQYHPSETKPKDAQEHGEATHTLDSARYAAMARKIVEHAPKKHEDFKGWKPPIQTWGQVLDKHFDLINNNKTTY